MAYFPPNARNGQTHKKFGRRFAYSETTESWTPVSTLASVAEVRVAEQAVEANNTTTYATAVELPLVGNTAGAMAFVQETNRLYLWSGTGWYNVATVTSAGASISGANVSYSLATDGTPTVVTLNQSGLTSPTWSYKVTSGSLGRTATVTQVDNVFTITPSALAKNVGSFGLTFKATDGSNTIVTSSQFTMSNTAPVIGTGPSATYALASDGTPTVITLAATDADGHAITWSYEVVSGSLGGTAVSIVGSVFTITPSVDTNDAGEFQLRFIASDGASFDAEVSAFTLAFAPDWAAATLLHTLDNPNDARTAVDDLFGYSVSISGNYAIVGAWTEDVAGGASDTGIAYIFNVTTGSLLHTLRPTSPSPNDAFGYSVSISGNYAIVGAPFTNNYSGKAYIFNVVTGVLTHTLDDVNVGWFGTAVAMDGNYAIVGAWLEDDAGGTQSGKAYIFNVTTGALLHTLDNPTDFGTSAGDSFGGAVAISGNYAIVGARYEDDGGTGLGEQGGTGASSGKAYIFDVTTGLRVHTLDNPNTHYTSASDQFGGSVAISGNYAAVGAPNEDNNGGNDSGVVYVFNVTTGALVHTLVNRNLVGTANGDTFGTSVSMDNYVIFVGAPAEDVGGSGGGGIYMYDVTTGALILPLTFYNNGAVAQGQLGTSVSVSGSYAIAGAPYQYSNGGNGGACKIFQAG